MVDQKEFNGPRIPLRKKGELPHFPPQAVQDHNGWSDIPSSKPKVAGIFIRNGITYDLLGENLDEVHSIVKHTPVKAKNGKSTGKTIGQIFQADPPFAVPNIDGNATEEAIKLIEAITAKDKSKRIESIQSPVPGVIGTLLKLTQEVKFIEINDSGTPISSLPSPAANMNAALATVKEADAALLNVLNAKNGSNAGLPRDSGPSGGITI